MLPTRIGLRRMPHVGGQGRGLGLVTVTSSPAITTIAQAIQTQEGYYPGSAAYTNNNPGNLMYAGQPGATPGPSGFAVFPSYDTGYQALLRQIQLDANNGMTISSMINSWAPATDANGNPIPGNNPQLYASNVAGALGVDPGTSVSSVFAGGAGNSIALDAGTDTGDGSVDSSTGLDLSSIGLGVMDWSTVGIAAGVAALALFLISRRR